MGEKEQYWLGYDLGGTKMRVQVFDQNFKELAKCKQGTKAHKGTQDGLLRIRGVIDEVLELAEIKPEQLSGIGVGCPGLVDHLSGVVLSAPNLNWSKVPLRDELQKAFSCPVALLNDVDAGVYGECQFGAGQGGNCVLGVFSGTGIGGGCVYQGQIIMGAKLSAMEIGHMQMVPHGALCGCGRRGCLEAHAGRLAIASAASAASQRGHAPWLREHYGTKLSNVRSKALAESVSHGDLAVENIIRQAAQWIGAAIGNMVNLLGPDIVVLGGGLAEAMPQLFLEEVTKTAKEHALPALIDSFQVAVAQLGGAAVAQGAAAWIKKQVQTT